MATKRLRVNGSWMDFRDAIKNRETFKAGRDTLYSTNAAFGTGRLPSDWTRTFSARRHVIDYVVYSYGTPIAWHDTEAGWIVPDEKYSVTTSKHQGRIATAISQL